LATAYLFVLSKAVFQIPHHFLPFASHAKKVNAEELQKILSGISDGSIGAGQSSEMVHVKAAVLYTALIVLIYVVSRFVDGVEVSVSEAVCDPAPVVEPCNYAGNMRFVQKLGRSIIL
jgi:hypothetical protein